MHLSRAFQFVAVLGLLFGPTLSPWSAMAQPDTFCPPGQAPAFVAGFAALKAQVGSAMGEPVTCEFPDSNGTGDVHQRTSTGLAFWRKSTNTPTFTDGYRHWGLAPAGLVAWTGSSIDPPPSSTGTGGDTSSFTGTWGGHGRSLDVRPSGTAFLLYRTYTWCNQGVRPPCDYFMGNEIISGGQVTLQFTSATPTAATGQVVATSAPMYPLGMTARLTLLPYDVVELRLGASDFGTFCGSGSPPGFCGA